MVHTAEETARRAEAAKFNVTGMCLKECRTWADIGAKYPDATTAARHAAPLNKDRNAPRGAMVYFTGGSRNHGHIAVSLGDGQIRSTDWPSPGRVGTTTIGSVVADWRLTYAGWSWEVNDVAVKHEEPKPPKPPAPSVVLQVMHASMQFSDNASQKKADAEKIFTRAKDRGVAWVTGTEGFEKDSKTVLAAAAKKNGYRFWMNPSQDSWIAIKETFITGGWSTHYEKILPGVAGQNTQKGVLAVSFNGPAWMGRVTVMASHFLTKGDPTRKPDFHLAQNKKLAKAIGDYAVQAGKGTALVFYGGDQNIQDKQTDTFLGNPLTSLWDELKTYESTGHGTIDVIASYDADGRVKGHAVNALNDKEFSLYTDHFLVEGSFTVKRLKP